MRLTIVAATGGIGRQILAQAQAAGHEIVAVVRDPERVPVPVRAVTVDLASSAGGAPAEVLESAVEGSEAVLSGLGPRSRLDAGVAWRGTQAIIQAMKARDVRRVLVVSAAPIGTVPSPARPCPPRFDPGDGFFMRHILSPVVRRVLSAHYADLARMEDVLRESGLDWTAVRPPRLTDGPTTGAYRTAVGRNLRRGLRVSRGDVAHLMLRAIHQPETFGQAVGIAD